MVVIIIPINGKEGMTIRKRNSRKLELKTMISGRGLLFWNRTNLQIATIQIYPQETRIILPLSQTQALQTDREFDLISGIHSSHEILVFLAPVIQLTPTMTIALELES